MRWLARWARRMADIIDPLEAVCVCDAADDRWPYPCGAGIDHGPQTDFESDPFASPRINAERTIVAEIDHLGRGRCEPCDTWHRPPLHYHTL